MTRPPPRFPLWLVRRCLRAPLADDVTGDLEERWRADRARGHLRAGLRLLHLAIVVSWHGLGDRWASVDRHGGMMTAVASVAQDLRFALRLFLRQRVSTLATVCTLALGIGATTTLYSVVHAWLLQPPPFADPNRLAVVWETLPSADLYTNTPAPAVFEEWRARSTSFEALAPLTYGTVNLTGEGEPARLTTLLVSPQLFGLLGVAPMLGRPFALEEGVAEDPSVAMLTHATFQERFGGEEDVIGRVVRLDGRPVQIVGVLPPDLRLLQFEVDLWLPFGLTGELRQSRNRFLWVLGRLRPDVSVARASSEIDQIALERSEGTTGGRVVGLRDQTLGATADDVRVLFGASAFVLFVACANVASLTLTQVLGRRREWLTRTAVGASRARLARQVLIEGLAVGLTGGAAGLVLAAWAVRVVMGLAPQTAHLGPVHVYQPSVVAFTLAATTLTAVLFALLPVWQATRVDLASGLRAGGRSGPGSRRRAMRALVVGEVALALVLLVGTALVVRSFRALATVDLGFDAAGLLTFELPRGDGDDARFFTELDERLREIPGIDRVAMSQALPLVSVGAMGSAFVVEGRTDHDASILAYWRVVNADYFRTLGIDLLAGRAFGPEDRAGSTPVAIATESYARRAWPGEAAIGRRIGWGSLERPLTVVGVVRDIRQSRGSPVGPHVYLPFEQTPGRVPRQVAVRSSLGTAATIQAVRHVVRELDAEQPVASIRTAEELLWRSMGRRRLHLALFSAFAGVAIVLALTGLYGVLSFQVAERRRDVGIRLALGATPGHIRRVWIRQSLSLVASGVAAGVILSWWASGLLEGFLFGVAPDDVPSLVLSVMVVTLTAAVVSLGPARRAARVDPIEPLRGE